MIPLIIVRPEPGASSTLRVARESGLDAHAFPIFTIRPVAWTPPPPQTVDAILLGSANAIRHGGEGLESLWGLPTYCVGQATAEAAESAGFPVAQVGTGRLQEVLSALSPDHRHLLRLAGVSHVPLALPPGKTMETRILYDSIAMPMDPGLAQALQREAVVLLHSGQAAVHFNALCADARIDRSRIALVVIGRRVVDLAGDGWAALEVATQPSDAGLLALAREMCQDAPRAP